MIIRCGMVGMASFVLINYADWHFAQNPASPGFLAIQLANGNFWTSIRVSNTAAVKGYDSAVR